MALFEFSQNFTVENIENPEIVKSIAKSYFKMCLIGIIQGFHDAEIFSRLSMNSITRLEPIILVWF